MRTDRTRPSLASLTPPFALLHRPELGSPGQVDLLTGPVSPVETLADLPVPTGVPDGGAPVHDLLAVVPYRQVGERGFAHRDDGVPLVAMQVREHVVLPLHEVADRADAASVRLRDARFDLDDQAYADLVRRVVDTEIGQGEGANFVLKRSFLATVEDFSVPVALAAFARLLASESGAYWTYLVHLGDRVLLGSSPERHVSVVDGTAVMNPISGTYRYPADGPSVAGALEFLADGKESDELFMVLDEELKMMGRVCRDGGRAIGPRLKTMSRLAHTEYLIEGPTDLDVRDVLRNTLFAPTVTGSPVESACRVIARHEPTGRAYYSGVVALIGREADGRQRLDSAITIRTADVDPSGRLRIDVGATLVRHSDPLAEAAETGAKAAALRDAFGGPATDAPPPRPASAPIDWADHPTLGEVLAARNAHLADFWFDARRGRTVAGLRAASAHRPPAKHRILVIDCEDTFTSMLRHQLAALGYHVVVRRYDEPFDPTDFDLVVAGPGPGDPTDRGDPKIDRMSRLVAGFLADRVPLLAICLGHQVLAAVLGLDLRRRSTPNQGIQLTVDYFGRVERCGFYSTFAARSATDRIRPPAAGGTVDLCRDTSTGEVLAMRGPLFSSVQFHPESVLTEHGIDILGELVARLLPAPGAGSPRPRPEAVAR
ncbi:anthranilate synthase family protein [Micromonospora sp. NPDC049523]|uniref:anthranilate synthase family protein n=1 Tax=Micromonospora sp. NPDC049523 TaxID=3155921 RepID=UPI00342E2A2D